MTSSGLTSVESSGNRKLMYKVRTSRLGELRADFLSVIGRSVGKIILFFHPGGLSGRSVGNTLTIENKIIFCGQ